MTSARVTGPPADDPDPFDALNEPFLEWYGEVEDAAFAALPAALVVHSTPTGGSYTLVQGGQETTVEPVRRRFGQLRSVTHVPLAAYALARGAADGALSGTAVAHRRADLARLVASTRPVVAGWAEPELRDAALAVLDRSADVLASEVTLDLAAVQQLTAQTKPAVDELMAAAGAMQADDCTALLERWHAELGDDAWAALVAIVGTAPAQRGPGTHTVIIERALGRDAVASGRLVVVVGLQDPTALRHRLGVVLANRVLAASWFGDAHRLESDLMTGAVTTALDAMGDGRSSST